MTSTIKVNNIQNQCGANIINENSNTITLGASGDTIALASGASQTGFGRTGTVDWQTGSIKTATFTAANGEGYFANTTGGAFTMNLPASPSAGNIVSVKDYLYTFATNNLTIGRNGSKIGGSSAVDLTISTNGSALTFIYVDSTQGWLVVNESTDTSQGLTPAFVAATGGTITCCGDFKIHTFTGPGTFAVSNAGNALGSNTVDYLVIAGGGSGGGGFPGGPVNHSGAGGAGGYRESGGTASGCYAVSPLGSSPSPVAALPVAATPYSISVGGGGSGSPNGKGTSGAVSTFSTITSAGGGAGGAQNACGGAGDALDGGSGGGAGPGTSLGSGNTPPVNPPQGQPGATPRGGGGGATGAGGSNPFPAPSLAPGGTGATSSITGSPVTRACGGSGGSPTPSPVAPVEGGGGAGGKGEGGPSSCAQGSPGTANTGGGGGNNHYGSGCAGFAGTNGGSGVVIIRYKFQ